MGGFWGLCFISLIISVFVLNPCRIYKSVVVFCNCTECFTIFLDNKYKCALAGISLPVIMRFVIFVFLKASFGVVASE